MRRYEKMNGRKVKTMELPWSLWLRVRPSVMKGVPGFEATEAARDRIAEVEAYLRNGHKSEYVADLFGMTGQRVRQIKARMKQKPPKAEARTVRAEDAAGDGVALRALHGVGELERAMRPLSNGHAS